MEHAAYMVDLLDERGRVVGKKPRRDINKAVDIHHTIFTLLITPRGELVLSVIPPREDLPNLYARQMGTTMATIRRSNETSLQAAHRGLSRELFIDAGEVHFLGRRMLFNVDSAPILATTYYLVGYPPETFSLIDIDTLVVVTPHQIRNLMIDHAQELAPTFREIWQSYHHKLPI